MSFSALLSKMLVLLVFICIGVLCSKLRFIDDTASGSLNKLVLYICGPMLILHSAENVRADYGLSDILMLLLYGVLFQLFMIVIGLLAAAVICRKKPIRGVFSLVSAFGNVIFMGIPVVSALYGDGAVFLLSVCAIPFNFFLFTLGIYLILGGGRQQIPWKKLVYNPSLFAVLVALVLFFLRVELPGAVTEIMGYLGQMVVPLSMLLIGAALGRMTLKDIFGSGACYTVCAVKLLAAPLLFFLVFRLFVKDPLILGLFTVMAAMPCASISPILCAEYGGDSAFASRSVFLSTVLSLATVPAMVWLLLL
ncbi:MAG: AEC family transporter [Ruminococcaceae bacterium]|nr:AEC family transporter [Oscillospiraceae bacterium]